MDETKRLGADEFLEKIKTSKAWEVKYTDAKELLLGIYNEDWEFEKYLEPDWRELGFLAWLSFTNRLNTITEFSEIKAKRRTIWP
jgi:hypothetical protein